MNCSHAGNTIVRWITPIKIFISVAMGETIPSTNVPDLVRGFGVENGVLFVESSELILDNVIDFIEWGQIEPEGLKSEIIVNPLIWDYITIFSMKTSPSTTAHFHSNACAYRRSCSFF